MKNIKGNQIMRSPKFINRLFIKIGYIRKFKANYPYNTIIF